MEDNYLNAILTLATVASAIAVVGTMLLLRRQLIENNKTSQLAGVDTLVAAITAINVPLTQDPQIGLAISKALKDWDTLDQAEKVKAHYFIFSFFKLGENAFFQYRLGALNEDQWQGWFALIHSYYQSAGIQLIWWPNRGNSYSKEFRDYLAKNKPTVEVNPLESIF